MLYIGIFLAIILAACSGYAWGLKHNRFASRDPLTGLQNKLAFDQYLETLQTRPLQEGGFGILFLDIDHFKQINDRHGHLAGDAVLCQLATQLRDCCSPNQVFRWGGDEFTLLVCGARTMLESTAQAIHQQVAQEPASYLHHSISFTVSIGAVHCDQNITSGDLLKRADQALYAAKSNGRNQISWSASIDK